MNTYEKMREALQLCVKQMSDAICDKDFGDDVVYLVGCMKTCIDYMKAALAEPRRNCDVKTDAEKIRRCLDFCATRNCVRCPARTDSTKCHINWKRMTCAPKEGGAK